MYNWYPQNKKELNQVLDEFLQGEAKKIHGLIAPHAGYEFSGEIAGKAFAMLKKNKKIKAIVIGPSHYIGFTGIRAIKNIETPLGKVKIMKHNFNINGCGIHKNPQEVFIYEHSIENQIPFLQKLGFKEILPLVIGEINKEQAKEIAKEISKIKDSIYIFSTDLSHFFPYDTAVKKDKETIRIIENLDFKNQDKIDACGKNALMILMELCRLKKYKPRLIEYKNSGDITGNKSEVVGYTSFSF